MHATDSTPYAKLPDFGIVVWLIFGDLFGCELNNFERAGSITAAEDGDLTFEVTAPDSQEFLDAANEALGSRFLLARFSGRLTPESPQVLPPAADRSVIGTDRTQRPRGKRNGYAERPR